MEWIVLPEILFLNVNQTVRHDRNWPREVSTLEPKTVVLKLNQQQLELLDKTISAGAAPDREALVKRALREYAARHASSAAGMAPAGHQP